MSFVLPEVAGLGDVKANLNRNLASVLCSGEECGCRRVFLYGAPGVGKTFLARALISEFTFGTANFQNMTELLVSKWSSLQHEDQLAQLFANSRQAQPALLILDDFDGFHYARQRSAEEKEEFIKQMTECATKNERIFVICISTKPWLLDPSLIQCFDEYVYVPLLQLEERLELIRMQLRQQQNVLTTADLNIVAQQTEGFTGADIVALMRSAAMQPVRSIQEATHFKRLLTSASPESEQQVLWTPCRSDDPEAVEMSWIDKETEELHVSPLTMNDLNAALSDQRPSFQADGLRQYESRCLQCLVGQAQSDDH